MSNIEPRGPLTAIRKTHAFGLARRSPAQPFRDGATTRPIPRVRTRSSEKAGGFPKATRPTAGRAGSQARVCATPVRAPTPQRGRSARAAGGASGAGLGATRIRHGEEQEAGSLLRGGCNANLPRTALFKARRLAVRSRLVLAFSLFSFCSLLFNSPGGEGEHHGLQTPLGPRPGPGGRSRAHGRVHGGGSGLEKGGSPELACT